MGKTRRYDPDGPRQRAPRRRRSTPKFFFELEEPRIELPWPEVLLQAGPGEEESDPEIDLGTSSTPIPRWNILARLQRWLCKR